MTKLRKQKLKAAKDQGRTAVLPKSQGVTALQALSATLARDLNSDYLEAKFSGKPVRCPIAPIAETSVVGDKMRVNLHHVNETTSVDYGDANANSNLAIVMPYLDHCLLTSSDTSVDLDMSSGSAIHRDTLTTRYRVENQRGDNAWNISSDVCFDGQSKKHAIFPYNPSGTELQSGYQVFDTDWIAANNLVSFDLGGAVYIEPTIETTLMLYYELFVTTLDVNGNTLVTQRVNFTVDGQGASANIHQIQPGTTRQFDTSANSVALLGGEESIVFTLQKITSQSSFAQEVAGALSFNCHFRPDAGGNPLPVWTIPRCMRHLETFDLSTFRDVNAEQYAIRSLAALFTFDGPLVSQGGFIGISEIKANEQVIASNLVDYVGSRAESHYGKVIEGAYGVYVEESLDDFRYRTLCQPYAADTKYMMCASVVTNPEQRLNISAIIDVGYEFLSNSLLYERGMAVPATYPQFYFAVMSAMPRFSSNDDHIESIIKPAIAIHKEAKKAASGGKSGWFNKLVGYAGTVGKSLLPMLPSLLAMV